MIGSAIREMAAARTVPLIAAAFFEGHVQIWDLAAQRMKGEFPIRFRHGSESLAMHPDGGSIVAGLSAKRGSVSAYSTPSGGMIWRREIEECAYLRFDRNELRVSFVRGRANQETIERLDAHSGVTVELLPGIDRYIDGPNDYALLSPSSGRDYLIVHRDKLFIAITKPQLRSSRLLFWMQPSAEAPSASPSPADRSDASIT
jgi:hypothetical protein